MGVSAQNSDTNFALFSKNASKVILNIYADKRKTADQRIELNPYLNKTGDVWHVSVTDLPQRFYYTYSLDGVWKPDSGLLYNAQNELVDPYAPMISGLETWRERDSGGKLFGFYEPFDYDWEDDKPINTPLKDTIIYEMHVRGFTQHHSSGTKNPGTYYGVVEKIDYLKELGITAVELLPVHEFDELDCKYHNPVTKEPLVNYWGYSTISFFALKSGYSVLGLGNQAKKEFCDMVKALHKAGIEVILDVVFNHSAEGGRDRGIFNFKGIDNQVYYILDEDSDYQNISGCGNAMNCNHPVVRNMIVDSLQSYVTELHVDGFRFDLASVLSRDQSGKVLEDPPVLRAIAEDPILSNTKIIAEPWDAGGLYQVGTFPSYNRWAEWNDKFRDAIRSFVNGFSTNIGDLATRISGSEDLFSTSGRKPHHSVNFITAHDGFTMMDLVSYNEKHNFENGEENRDGTEINFSRNYGEEGETSHQLVTSERHLQIRNMATLLMISQGIPMILAGDEFGNTQNGNNNAWCQDNEISWLDWDCINRNRELLHFWQKLIQFRKDHPNFKRGSFFSGETNPVSKHKDISWHGIKANQPNFSNQEPYLAILIDGLLADEIVDDRFYIAINFSGSVQEFEIPDDNSSDCWSLVLDTFDYQSFIDGISRKIGQQQKSIRINPNSIKILSKALN